jgi:iron complex transport system substrate-binding protein
MRLLAATLGALILAGTAAADRAWDASVYLINHQRGNGGFAEPGAAANAGLTAWAILGLRADDHCVTRSGRYIRRKPAPKATDLALRILALDALRDGCAFNANLSRQIRRLQTLRWDNGRIGPSVNSTIWGILALRATGRRAGERTVRWLVSRQRPSGGWSWFAGGNADSNDTAAAIQALRSVGVPPRARVINRAVRYLRRLQNQDGGFELTAGRGSDTQSTAWAIQALVAADRRPGRAAFRYLRRMQRPNGSFRYDATHVTTPVWVTAQALPALVRKPFPLK